MMKKRVIRLGLLLIIISFSLGLSAIAREDVQETYQLAYEKQILSYQSDVISFFSPPRNIRIEIDSNGTLNFFLFDEFNFKQMRNKTESLLTPVFSLTGIHRGIYFTTLPKRCMYYALIENTLNKTIFYSITLFVFGFEADILLYTEIFFISGGILVILGLTRIQSYLEKKSWMFTVQSS